MDIDECAENVCGTRACQNLVFPEKYQCALGPAGPVGGVVTSVVGGDVLSFMVEGDFDVVKVFYGPTANAKEYECTSFQHDVVSGEVRKGSTAPLPQAAPVYITPCLFPPYLPYQSTFLLAFTPTNTSTHIQILLSPFPCRSFAPWAPALART